jgi:hypothetical protein
MDLQQRFKIPSDVLIREIAEESVLLNLATESYFGLNEVGTRFWNALTQGEPLQQTYDSLLREFEVSPEVLQADLSRLIDELVTHGLLEIDTA